MFFTPVAKVWKQLAQGFERYNAVLAERSRRITNVKALQVMAIGCLKIHILQKTFNLGRAAACSWKGCVERNHCDGHLQHVNSSSLLSSCCAVYFATNQYACVPIYYVVRCCVGSIDIIYSCIHSCAERKHQAQGNAADVPRVGGQRRPHRPANENHTDWRPNLTDVQDKRSRFWRDYWPSIWIESFDENHVLLISSSFEVNTLLKIIRASSMCAADNT